MMNKTIGILTHITDPSGNTPSFGLNAVYLRYFRQFGNIVMIDPGCQKVIDVDLLVLPGGRDVDTTRYNEVPDTKTQNPDIHYEWFDKYILPLYVKENIPIFGICRGFQTGNVFFGGKLNQHINQAYSGNDRSSLVDTLKLTENQPVDVPKQWITGNKNFSGKVINNLYLKVNSLHHQGIYEKNHHVYPATLSEEMLILAKNIAYGNVEAMMHQKYPFIAVQWHPEEMDDDKYSPMLINYLLNK